MRSAFFRWTRWVCGPSDLTIIFWASPLQRSANSWGLSFRDCLAVCNLVKAYWSYGRFCTLPKCVLKHCHVAPSSWSSAPVSFKIARSRWSFSLQRHIRPEESMLSRNSSRLAAVSDRDHLGITEIKDRSLWPVGVVPKDILSLTRFNSFFVSINSSCSRASVILTCSWVQIT